MNAVGERFESCPCYKCTGREVVEYDDEGRRVVMNNLHGRLEPCPECDRRMTEWVDRYTWGYYECWFCNYRNEDTSRDRPNVPSVDSGNERPAFELVG